MYFILKFLRVFSTKSFASLCGVDLGTAPITTCRDGPACKKYRNKAWMKTHKKAILLWKNSGKERFEDYSTFVA